MTAFVVGVLGASGGVGTSTAAGHLAWRGPSRLCLLDADTVRGAIDVTVGIDHVMGPRWGSFERLSGRADGPGILAALPSTSRYAVLAGGQGLPPPPVVEAVLDAVVDTAAAAVIDLGTGLGLAAPFLPRCDAVVVIAGLGVRHLADLDRLLPDLPDDAPPVHLVTRGAKGLRDIARSVADHTRLVGAGHWPDDPRVARDLERGLAPGEGARGFDTLADRLWGVSQPHSSCRSA